MPSGRVFSGHSEKHKLYPLEHNSHYKHIVKHFLFLTVTVDSIWDKVPLCFLQLVPSVAAFTTDKALVRESVKGDVLDSASLSMPTSRGRADVRVTVGSTVGSTESPWIHTHRADRSAILTTAVVREQ